MKKKLMLGLLLLTMTLFTGCFESMKNSAERDGGFFTSSKGDYIIVNTSGNRVLDVYKLRNKFVDNQANTDGIGFVDNHGDYTLISGDAKVIRVKNALTWDKYIEYHFDEEFCEDLAMKKRGL